MIAILLFFIIGLFIGLTGRRIKGMQASSSLLTQVAVFLLLFLLGLGVGNSEEIRNHLDEFGLTGILIASFSILGSILAAWLTWTLFYRHK